MFMRSLGQFSSPLVLGFMARTAGASDIRFPYEGAALLSVVMMGVFWVNGLVRSSLKKQAGLLNQNLAGVPAGTGCGSARSSAVSAKSSPP
ncbi:MAG: hypothetical protein ACLTW9_22510 [Enterocloster sp.]